jgi:D-alanine-D-alanine ligase
LKLKVLVLMGGASTEREISLITGRAVAQGLADAGHDVGTYDLDPGHGRDVLDLVSSREAGAADAVFIALHGGEGEDGRIQAALELTGFAYTGSGPRASALCMDKSVSKTLMEYHGIATPPWTCLRPDDGRSAGEAAAAVGGLPCVVKPVDQGSTIGITIVRQEGELARAIELARRYSEIVLFEKYIGGKELSVAIVGDEAYPTVEIKPKEGFYDYERKYTKGMTLYDCPAKIGEALSGRIEDEALRAYRMLGCEGFARVDLRLDEGGSPYFLEVNTIPGMTETSLVPMAAEARGMSFPELVDVITSLALKRKGPRPMRIGG